MGWHSGARRCWALGGLLMCQRKVGGKLGDVLKRTVPLVIGMMGSRGLMGRQILRYIWSGLEAFGSSDGVWSSGERFFSVICYSQFGLVV